jgi:hypothetical protein
MTHMDEELKKQFVDLIKALIGLELSLLNYGDDYDAEANVMIDAREKVKQAFLHIATREYRELIHDL